MAKKEQANGGGTGVMRTGVAREDLQRVKRPEDLCPAYPEWPRRWMGMARDVPYGQGLIDAMCPFIDSLIASGLSDKTVRKHMDNLWLLGGEIIRDVNTFDEYDEVAPHAKLIESVGPEGGRLCRQLDCEAQIRSFDSTCRRLHTFLKQHARVQPLTGGRRRSCRTDKKERP